MTIATAGVSRFELGQVIQGAFGAIKNNFLTFLILSVVFSGIPGLVYAWFTIRVAPTDYGEIAGLSLIGSVVTLISGCILEGALVHGAYRDMNQRKASLADCLRAGLTHFLPLLGIGILYGLGVAVGFLLVIVPGVLLLLAWAVAGPVQVVEGGGIFRAFRRSAVLTRDHRWAILGMFILVSIISWLLQRGVGLLATVLASAVKAPQGWDQLVSIPVGQMVGALLNGTVAAVLYFELRRSKEGVTRDDLADVFD